MLQLLRSLTSVIPLAAATFPFSLSASAQQIPAQLQLPANEQLLLQVHANGDQVYICQEDVTQFAWALKAPDAQLFDKDGSPSASTSPDLRGKPPTAAASLAKPPPVFLRPMPIPLAAR